MLLLPRCALTGLAISDAAQEMVDSSIRIRTNEQGLPTGECYVTFASEDALTKALERNRQVMGHRFVSVERASAADYASAFKSVAASPPPPPPAPAPAPPPAPASARGSSSPTKQQAAAAAGHGSKKAALPYISAATAASPPASVAAAAASGGGKGGGGNGASASSGSASARGGGGASQRASSDSTGGSSEPSGGGGNIVIKMRGLPYSTTEQEITAFFTGLKIASGGISIGRDANGRASGEAHVEFASDQDSQSAMLLNRQRIGSRYIELFRTRQAPSAARRALASTTSDGANGTSDCLRLRGMPFNSTEADVQAFFKG